MSKINVILPCGGKSKRSGLSYNKVLTLLGGKPLIYKTAWNFSNEEISRIIIVCTDEDKKDIKIALENTMLTIVYAKAGRNRVESVFNGLKKTEKDCEYVMIHDGARPFVTQTIINENIAMVKEKGNAIACVPLTDSLRRINAGEDTQSCNREEYMLVQTPQTFKKAEIMKAYDFAINNSTDFTDDASIYEKFIGKVFISKGHVNNIKITYPADIEKIIPIGYYVGCGWDTHEFAEGRKLILGGVNIPCDKGLKAHSDGDVIIHSIMDAILSAAGEKDIGYYFPDTDDRYLGVSSIELLKKVNNIIMNKGYKVNNISSEIMAQKPKLKNYISSMKENISNAINLSQEHIGIGATTTERLGFVGREEGISVVSYVSLVEI